MLAAILSQCSDNLSVAGHASRLYGRRMTTIAFVSQKGGVAKSTLSRALAREVTSAGMSVKIADLDVQQGTTANWHRRRLAAGIEPVIAVEAFRTAAQALKAGNGYDLLILDGPARASAATLEIARHADLIVQPTGTSLDDLEPAVLLFHELVREKVPRATLSFALCRVGTEAEELEARGNRSPPLISQAAAGMGWCEMPQRARAMVSAM
jgi:chromosome partitioning protein